MIKKVKKINYLSSIRLRCALILSSAAIPALAWAGALRAQATGKVAITTFAFLDLLFQRTATHFFKLTAVQDRA